MLIQRSILLLLSGLLYAHSLVALPDDQEQIIEIFSNQAQHDNKIGLSSYIGEVIMQQGSIKIEADTLRVNRDSESLIASGKPAHFAQRPNPDEPFVHARANTIHYFRNTGIIELTGNASVEQADTKITGERIIYDANKQTLDASSANTQQSDKPQRIHVVIPPQNKTQKAEP